GASWGSHVRYLPEGGCGDLVSPGRLRAISRNSQCSRGGTRHSPNGIYGMSCPIRGSIRLDARELDYRGPFLGFVSDKPAKVGGRHRHRRAAQVDQPGLHLWIDESAVGFLVELLDDVSWRVLGRTDAVPTARLVARHKLSHRRDVRQRLQARRGGYSARAPPARLAVL